MPKNHYNDEKCRLRHTFYFLGREKKLVKNENRGRKKETFKNSCVIYRRKMTLAFASLPMRDGAIFFRAGPQKKKKALQQLRWVLYARYCWMAHQMKPCGGPNLPWLSPTQNEKAWPKSFAASHTKAKKK